MDSCLTQGIEVSTPPWRKYSRAPTIPGYKEVTSLTPIITEFIGLQDSEGQLGSDNLFGRLKEFEGSGDCVIETLGQGQKQKTSKGFCKVTHILDPVLSLKHYYKHKTKGASRMAEKIDTPMNQAYIDTLANYLLGQLRERDISPHFCLFYGGFKAVAEKYRFNITEEFGSFRRYREFWNRKRAGEFNLHVERDDDESVEHDLFKTPQSSLRSTAFSYSTDSSDSSESSESEGSHESLDLITSKESKMVELESVHSFKTGSSASDSESDMSLSDNVYSVFSEFNDYPVMMIFQERMEGVIDDMLEDDSLVGATHGSAEWEGRWIAWTFQIVAALCAAQGVLGFTHNDLHTNNIVWTQTEESWLYYKNRSGVVWRVPTYGRIFRIIDFGRSIFRVKDKWFVSDDYNYGGDAEGQYNFACTKNSRSRKIYPNPSFDLCRYAVSVMDALFPEMPAENLEGAILSKEGSWTIRETESPLWNLLWKWLLDKDGRNVLKEEDGTERFPDFDLYSHITENVTGAKPQDQLNDVAFSSFKVDSASVGEWETVYPLFC
jgi:hypothetical protein